MWYKLMKRGIAFDSRFELMPISMTLAESVEYAQARRSASLLEIVFIPRHKVSHAIIDVRTPIYNMFFLSLVGR